MLTINLAKYLNHKKTLAFRVFVYCYKLSLPTFEHNFFLHSHPFKFCSFVKFPIENFYLSISGALKAKNTVG